MSSIHRCGRRSSAQLPPVREPGCSRSFIAAKETWLCFGDDLVKLCASNLRCEACPQEELDRRRQRAARFQTEDRLAEYRPPTDPEAEERKRERAERFGTTYEPPDETGLIEVGVRPCVALSTTLPRAAIASACENRL